MSVTGTAMTGTAVIAARDARSRLTAAARRSAELIASLDLDQPVSRSQWTVGQTAAHLVSALRGFTDAATGDHREWLQLEDSLPDARAQARVEALNRSLIAAEPRLSSFLTARAITDGVDAFLAATAALPPGRAVPTPWYGEHETLTVAEATCLLLGEQVMHGYDIAKAVGRKWPITKHDALLIFEAGRQMMPKYADPVAIGDTSTTYELRLGRSARFVVRIAGGAAIVEPVADQRIDCHVLAEPVAMLLLAYGRINQWQAIGRAKMITWGTKPWMAFRFASFFSHP